MCAYYWTFFISTCLIVGCYTAKKAEKQQAKVILKHRTVAARAFLKEFPNRAIHDTVFTTNYDSAAFIKARDEAIADSKKVAALSKKNIDSLNKRISSMSDSTKSICADIILINDWLTNDNETMNKTITRLYSLPPKIEYRDRKTTEIDSTLYFLAVTERDHYKELYDIDHKWRVNKEKKENRSLTLHIPWWVIISLAIAAMGFSFLKFRTKPLNLLK